MAGGRIESVHVEVIANGYVVQVQRGYDPGIPGAETIAHPEGMNRASFDPPKKTHVPTVDALCDYLREHIFDAR